MRVSIALLNTFLAIGVVSGAPSAPCNQNSGAAYYCQDSSFYVCQTTTSTWLLQNVCDGDCCDIPAYAAFCPNCSNKPTTSVSPKPTTTTTTKSTTKPTTKTTSTNTKTTSIKPDPTVAPGAGCNNEGSYGCSGSNFLICHDKQWLLQNVCNGDCCSVPAFAAHCYNCGDKPITTTTAPKPTTTKTTTKTTKPTSTKTTSIKPDPTVAPGAKCGNEGSFGCTGSNFLVCQEGQWELQNNCGGTCCSIFQYAQYCYNC
ncbi:hypothetical protein K493DRAFT_336214 [Basidiobolus meristosporus CBS 931.73]|uniref:CBM1 domain-containing protein n=1 Tax=Basidiobolus meristosporus CBS 931.73 TaxID=1314790 RepID=A0A1Y1YJY8_9FUNG|nr:hypothetical protein K493DRAFT_336214 [Basidiobolus meristosporus CBS 931.73]|eukprot:ORX98282.1 hypothetical protein K493DRAFT_336214 [Basidiobolus meristosporus CBS 931.73]